TAIVLDVIIAEYSDGINQSIRALRFLNRIRKTAAAGIIDAIGHDQENFLILGRLFQVIERSDHGIIQRRAASGINAVQGILHFVDVTGEVVNGVEIKIVIEIDHERFVLRVAGLHQRQSGGVYLG